MSGKQEFDDEYVANLLKRDAETNSIKFSALGSQSFISARMRNAAPKPNTRFLRNMLRETDSHNAALLAREQQEARARQRQHASKQSSEDMRRRERNRSRDADDPRTKRRRVNESDDTEDRYSRSHRDRHRRRSRSPRRSHREKEQNNTGKDDHKRRGEHYDSDCSSVHCSHDRRREEKRMSFVTKHGSSRHNSDTQKDHSKSSRRRRSTSRTPPFLPSQMRSHSRKSLRSPELQSRSYRQTSISPATNRRIPKPENRKRRPTSPHLTSTNKPPSRSPSTTSTSSDPLSTLLGPAPPPKIPIRGRGRGTFTTCTNHGTAPIDAHFSATYDATADVQPDPDTENDWDQALEALRDRQRWRKVGAERLRAAGFSEGEVEKWENGGGGVMGGGAAAQAEKGEADVKWAKKGEGREWDRGKVVGEGGTVDIRADWGRLK